VTALHVQHGDWLDARMLQLASVTTESLRVESRYVHPLSLALTQRMPLVPGLLELKGRLELTLSGWQTTFDRHHSYDAPPLLLCSSGSSAAATLGATVAQAVSLALLAGIQDDPVHFEDGSDCLGGGPVWQSSRWMGVAVESRPGKTWKVSLAARRTEHRLHVTTHEHAGEDHAGHEHVRVSGYGAVEAGAWLAADL
jgi:hypothetical protein